MEKDNVLKIFLDALESTPGIAQIMCLQNDLECSHEKIKAEKINDNWNFSASLILLKNTNCKDVLNSIHSLLKYKLKKEKLNLGKINIIIEGIAND
ncbi:hypothetical protein [Mycoplasmopsis iners]|uniref:hypothetical protein n=1 Tax=Mycoplasmopsis iners TaxID=76630 RepID=UPI0004980210|nr:hypothetical protein [Mycoplasmopsis iners]